MSALFTHLVRGTRGAVVVAAVVAASAAAMAQGGVPDAFRIGGVVSLSGTYGIYGVDMRKGVELAIQERGGKVLGKPIEVIWEDDETKPQPAVQKTTRLIASGVDMIFGAVSSTSTIAVMNVTKQRKVPHLVTTSADDKITLPGASRYTFRTGNNFGLETAMTHRFTLTRKLQRVYGVIADYGATRDGWNWYRAEAEKSGVRIVGEAFAPLGNRDYAAIVDAIARSDADGVAVFTSGSDSVTFLKQAAGVNLAKSRVIFGPGFIDDALATAVGPGALGVYSGVRSHFSLDNATNRAFVAAYRKMYDEYPSSAAGEAYDGMSWWLDTVEKTGVWDKEKWVDAFAVSVRENSISGRKEMRACDHQSAHPGLWGVAIKGTPPQPAYVMKIDEVFAPDRLFVPCSSKPA